MSDFSYGSASIGPYFVDEFDSSDMELDDEEADFERKLLRIKRDDSRVCEFHLYGEEYYTNNLSHEQWEQIGRDISNNTCIYRIELCDRAINNNRLESMCRGLTKSTSISTLLLENNDLSTSAARSLVPLFQNSNDLETLSLEGNNFQSEGFNILTRALRDSPIRHLYCNLCGIDSIEIDTNCFPRNLKELTLNGNKIKADGCRALVKLLQGGDSTLTLLDLGSNEIDDDGVMVLTSALRNNTTMEELLLHDNKSISNLGRVQLLKLVNDISSINATLQSNHTLIRIGIMNYSYNAKQQKREREIDRLIGLAAKINRLSDSDPKVAGREKVIQTHLHSANRAEIANVQNVNHSFHKDINPLHLPELLSLVGRRHGQGELYVALKSVIAEVISTVNRKKCLLLQRDYHVAKTKQINAELAQIEAAESNIIGGEAHNKRRRKGGGESGAVLVGSQALSVGWDECIGPT